MVVFSREALEDLQLIRAYIGKSNPALAERQARRIRSAIKTLDQFAEIGRRGRETGTWEITIRPWIAVYKINADGVLIVHIWHGRRERDG